MTRKSEFNADEWTTLTEGPLMAGFRVLSAGRGGTIRESLAMGKVYAKARQAHGGNELLDELVATPPALDPSRLGSPQDIGTRSAQRLREAVGILEAKADQADVAAYKAFIGSIAETVAEANSEGGMLGIGGKPVSDEEQAALAEIRSVLSAGPA